MDKKIKILFVFILMLLVVQTISSISAVSNLDIPLPTSLGNSYGTFKLKSNISLVQTCTNQTGFCDECNLTSLKYPDGTIIAGINIKMTKSFSLFNFTLGEAYITKTGKYFVTGFCTAGGIYSPWSYTFEVTPTGEDFSEAKAFLYGSLFFIFVFFMVSLVFLINQLPASNTKDEEGKILSISYLKYLRPALWFVEWMLFVAILYLSSNLAFAYLGEQLFAKILFTLFRITFGVTPVIVIVWFIWMFVKMFHDKQLQNMINRGIFPQGKL